MTEYAQGELFQDPVARLYAAVERLDASWADYLVGGTPHRFAAVTWDAKDLCRICDVYFDGFSHDFMKEFTAVTQDMRYAMKTYGKCRRYFATKAASKIKFTPPPPTA